MVNNLVLKRAPSMRNVERPRVLKDHAPYPPAVPAGMRVFAIGDIHGRDDLLSDLLAQIAADLASRPADESVIVFLGDYVDRGPGTKAVVERLSTGAMPGSRQHFLLGNHEAEMLRALSGQSDGDIWMQNGGAETLRSYGVSEVAIEQRDRDAWLQNIPEAHLAFLRALQVHARIGDYLFVHAGFRPGVAINQQREEDLIWIRDAFINSDWDFGAVVVHGHTIRDVPDVRHNRIGIDTGAWRTGTLTAVVLEGTDFRFINT